MREVGGRVWLCILGVGIFFLCLVNKYKFFKKNKVYKVIVFICIVSY